MEKHVTRSLPAYHDGELPADQQTLLGAHLAVCPACRAELDALRSLSGVLKKVPAAAPPVTAAVFLARLEARLKSEPAPAWSTAPTPRVAGWGKVLRLAWQAIPLGIVGAWVVLQAVLLASALLIALGADAYLSLPLAESLQLAPDLEWLLVLLALWLPGLGLNSELWLAVLGQSFAWAAPLAQALELLIIELALTGVAGLLLSSWLAGWWVQARQSIANQTTKVHQ